MLDLNAILRFAVVAALTLTAGGGAATQQQNAARVIHISAERFSFTPSEIRIDAGDEVELRIHSEDTAHGFRLIGTGLGGIVPKRGKGELSIVLKPAAVGRYTFECSRMCGAGHDFMRGVIIVAVRTEKSTLKAGEESQIPYFIEHKGHQ